MADNSSVLEILLVGGPLVGGESGQHCYVNSDLSKWVDCLPSELFSHQPFNLNDMKFLSLKENKAVRARPLEDYPYLLDAYHIPGATLSTLRAIRQKLETGCWPNPYIIREDDCFVLKLSDGRVTNATMWQEVSKFLNLDDIFVEDLEEEADPTYQLTREERDELNAIRYWDLQCIKRNRPRTYDENEYGY